MEKEVRDIYDKLAKTWHTKRRQKTFYNDFLEMPATLSLLKNVKNKKILDLGCGTGVLSKILKRRGAKVFGVDVSPKMIDLAKSNVKGVDFRTGSVYKLPYKSNYFDIVVASLVLHYFKNLNKAFKEIRRVLKKNGILIFSTDNPVVCATRRMKGKSRTYRVFTNYFKERKLRARWPMFKITIPYRHITYQTWIKTIVKNGFTIEDYIDVKPIKKGKKIKRASYEFTSKVPYFCIFKIRKL